MAKGKSFLIGFLIGGTVSAATTLLSTPSSGKELRERIKQQSIEWKEYQLDYAKHYGGDYPGDAIEKMAEQGKVDLMVFDTSGSVALGTPPDDIKRIDDSIKD